MFFSLLRKYPHCYEHSGRSQRPHSPDGIHFMLLVGTQFTTILCNSICRMTFWHPWLDTVPNRARGVSSGYRIGATIRFRIELGESRELSMEVEQKPFAQKKPDQLVYLELGAGNGGMLLSISEDGFRFRAVSPLRQYGSMPFAFSLDGQQRLEGAGEIEWLEDDGKSGGMRFTDISPEFRTVLQGWLASGTSRTVAHREVVPTASTPLDTMEKIRQELRSGYPTSPRRPAAQPEPPNLAPEPKAVAATLPLECKPEPVAPVVTEPPAGHKEFSSVKRLFPLPAGPLPAKPEAPKFKAPRPEPAFSQPVKTSATSSAFLKAPRPASPDPVAPAIPSLSIPEAPIASIPPLSIPTTLIPPVSAPREPRLVVPPLEDSFELAWERAKIVAPEESPRLGRAAASSIIAIALSVILGALAFNFRQDIGWFFISVGRKISGESRAADPLPAPELKAETKPETVTQVPTSDAPSSVQSSAQGRLQSPAQKPPEPAQPAVASPNGAATRNSAPANAGTAPETKNSMAAGAQNSAAPRKNPASAAAADTGGPEASAAKAPVSSPEQPAADSGTGQEEFAAALDILRGGNRGKDLPKAVDLLWTSVKKGHVPAEVALADLYRRGDGVERNCDQARILLVAASKKGSTEARQLLEQIAEQGCE
jgi:hypothetical protein